MGEPIHGYQFGPFRIEVARRQLLRDNQPVTLPLKAFDTLVLLVTHHDRVVGKDEILKSVWSDSFVTEDHPRSRALGGYAPCAGRRRLGPA